VPEAPRDRERSLRHQRTYLAFSERDAIRRPVYTDCRVRQSQRVAYRCPKTGHVPFGFYPVDPVTALPRRGNLGFEYGGVRDSVGGKSLEVEFADEHPSCFVGKRKHLSLAEGGAVEGPATTEPGAHLDGLWPFLFVHVHHGSAVHDREKFRFQSIIDKLVRVRGASRTTSAPDTAAITSSADRTPSRPFSEAGLISR